MIINADNNLKQTRKYPSMQLQPVILSLNLQRRTAGRTTPPVQPGRGQPAQSARRAATALGSAAAPLAYSPAGYGVVSGVDSDDNGGQFVPIMMPPQHQPRATMTPSPQPVPAQRRSFERSQQNQVMQGPDERATFPHQQQPPPPQQKPRSSKPKPTMSHSEVALELVWSGMHLEAMLRDIRYAGPPVDPAAEIANHGIGRVKGYHVGFGILHPVADAGENIVGHVILGQRPADVIQPHAALNVQTELLVLADAGVHPSPRPRRHSGRNLGKIELGLLANHIEFKAALNRTVNRHRRIEYKVLLTPQLDGGGIDVHVRLVLGWLEPDAGEILRQIATRPQLGHLISGVQRRPQYQLHRGFVWRFQGRTVGIDGHAPAVKYTTLVLILPSNQAAVFELSIGLVHANRGVNIIIIVCPHSVAVIVLLACVLGRRQAGALAPVECSNVAVSLLRAGPLAGLNLISQSVARRPRRILELISEPEHALQDGFTIVNLVLLGEADNCKAIPIIRLKDGAPGSGIAGCGGVDSAQLILDYINRLPIEFGAEVNLPAPGCCVIAIEHQHVPLGLLFGLFPIPIEHADANKPNLRLRGRSRSSMRHQCQVITHLKSSSQALADKAQPILNWLGYLLTYGSVAPSSPRHHASGGQYTNQVDLYLGAGPTSLCSTSDDSRVLTSLASTPTWRFRRVRRLTLGAAHGCFSSRSRVYARVLGGRAGAVLPVACIEREENAAEAQRDAAGAGNPARLNPPPLTALFCGMHVIVNLAAAAEAALREWETCMAAEAVGSAALPGFRPSQAESGTQRLIRTAQAFHALGSELGGIPLQTLESKGPSLRLDDPWQPAYITFPNGGNIFWHETACPSSWLSHCSNRLDRVQADLASDLLLSGCRALGIHIMATHMLVLLEREVRDHLPGGTLRQLTPEVAQLVSSAPKDNVAVERGFGMLDKCVADRPNMRPLARESLVLFGYNCTSEWLADKTEREKDLLLTRARKLVPQLEKRGKESADALRSCRQEILRAKLAEKQRKKDSNAESIRSILRVIEAYGGLWPTISRMDAVLHQLAPDQHEKAIKAQLQLHKATKIHLPKDKASLLNFSAAGVKRSVPQLRSQLREVLQIVELQDQQKGADAPTVPPSGLLDARERKERVRTAIADRLQRHNLKSAAKMQATPLTHVGLGARDAARQAALGQHGSHVEVREDAAAAQVVERQRHLGECQTHGLLAEANAVLDVEAQVPAEQKVDNNEHVFNILEGEPQVDQIGKVQAGNDADLPQHVADGVLLDAGQLVHVLHCEHPLAALQLHDAHLAKGAAADRAQNVEAVEAD
uniref:ANK_REP_REGION domain-containing protein n=1 Tax=Macrostomum lignano TaxID=282301 RepID=A0A1I8I1C3_9PLAT